MTSSPPCLHLFEENQFTEVTHVHKLVLSSCSTYFKKMLQVNIYSNQMALYLAKCNLDPVGIHKSDWHGTRGGTEEAFCSKHLANMFDNQKKYKISVVMSFVITFNVFEVCTLSRLL